MASKKWRVGLTRFLRERGVRFWSVAITAVSIAVLFIGSQVAQYRGQSVDWYTGFGQWLGALGSFVAAGAALWISTSDRRHNEEEKRHLHEQQEADLKRRAGLVIVTAQMIGRGQPVGPSIPTPAIGVRNRRAEPIFDIEVVKFVHGGAEHDLVLDRFNGFAISPPRENRKGGYYQRGEMKSLALQTDEWLVIYQQGSLPNTPAEYAAVRYTDRAGGRWEVDTLGAVARQ